MLFAREPRRPLNPTAITGQLIAALLALGLTLASRAQALVYWTNNGNDTIGRANLDGTGANPSFIAGAVGPTGRTPPPDGSGAPTSTARA